MELLKYGSLPSGVSVSFDLRSHLQNELVERCRRNPRYSLRAFARAVGLESSYLSKILLGRRSVTPSLVDRLASALRLTTEQVASAKLDISNQKISKAVLRARKREFHELSSDCFEVIANWYHYAILELTQLTNFQSDPAWIARKLEIPKKTAEEAIERLKRLELISVSSHGRFKSKENCTTLGSPFTNVAFQRLQTELLSKAKWAMEKVPLDLRDQSSITMAIDSKKIPQAKEKIKKFRRGLMRSLQSSSTRDTVYEMVISFFPASQNLMPNSTGITQGKSDS